MNVPADVLLGLVLGFSLTIPPGPMNALIANRSVESLRAGIVTGLGAMSSDAILGAAVFSLQLYVDLHRADRIVYLLGAAAMAFLGVRLLRAPAASVAPPGERSLYGEALVVGLSNPFQILWWLTAGLASVYLGGAPLLGGLFGAIAVWIVAFPSAVHAGTRRSPRAQRGVRYVSAATVLAFAAYFAVLAV